MNPCKDCTNRHVKCHSECKDYQEWRTNRPKEYKRDEATEFLITNIQKHKRRSGK